MTQAAAAPRYYLDARLKPRRSMSPRMAVLLMVPVLAVNVVFAIVCTVMGGAFVPPFLGLDVLGLGLALWLNFRAARRSERIRVSADAIEVVRETPTQSHKVWTSAPVFTRIELTHPGRHASRLRLWCKGKGLTLGAFLAPAEREAFAERLKSAVSEAKAERW